MEARGRILGAWGSAAAASLSYARGRVRRHGELARRCWRRGTAMTHEHDCGYARSYDGVGVGRLARARADAVLGTARLVKKGSPAKQNRKRK